MENDEQTTETASAATEYVNVAIAPDQKENEHESIQEQPAASSSAPGEVAQNQPDQPEKQQSHDDAPDSKPSTSTAEPDEPEPVDPNKEVLPGNLRDYDEYEHDSTEDIRKKQLAELVRS